MNVKMIADAAQSYLNAIGGNDSEKDRIIKLLLEAMQREPLEWNQELGCFIPKGMSPEKFERIRDGLRKLAPEKFFDGAWADDGIIR